MMLTRDVSSPFCAGMSFPGRKKALCQEHGSGVRVRETRCCPLAGLAETNQGKCVDGGGRTHYAVAKTALTGKRAYGFGCTANWAPAVAYGMSGRPGI